MSLQLAARPGAPGVRARSGAGRLVSLLAACSDADPDATGRLPVADPDAAPPVSCHFGVFGPEAEIAAFSDLAETYSPTLGRRRRGRLVGRPRRGRPRLPHAASRCPTCSWSPSATWRR